MRLVDVALPPVGEAGLTKVVGSFAMCVAADAAAALTPMHSRIVAEVTPKPMPSVPSTICAAPPARAKAAKNHMIDTFS